MFISKKKYNEAIEKAKKEAEERAWQIHRYNSLEDRVFNKIGELEQRIIELESFENTPKEFNPVTDALPNCRCAVKPRM